MSAVLLHFVYLCFILFGVEVWLHILQHKSSRWIHVFSKQKLRYRVISFFVCLSISLPFWLSSFTVLIWYMSILCFIALCFIVLLRFYLFFKKQIEQASLHQHHFSNSVCLLLVSVLRFGNSCSIPNILIIAMFVTVISDFWCYYCKRIKWWLAYFSDKYF